MAHATVGYCFDGNPENGGEGLLIGLNRCQAYKVAQKAYRGKSGIKVVKGDCLLTDCNVTGTDVGTPDKPKFALRALWEYSLLPSLDALVAVCRSAGHSSRRQCRSSDNTSYPTNAMPNPHPNLPLMQYINHIVLMTLYHVLALNVRPP
jgi:hypothetical protein